MSIDDFDQELYDHIQELVERGDLEVGTAAYGVALLAVDVGYNGLTPKQRYVYDTYVAPLIEELEEEYEVNA